MKKKLVFLLSVTTMCLFAGCGTTPTTESKKDSNETITIVSRLMENESKILTRKASEWSEKTGVRVNIVQDEANTASFEGLLASENGPDIIVGMAHDNLGSFIEKGLIQEVPSGLFNEDEYVNTSVWDATSYGGKRYAVPFAMETYSLLYNKDMISKVPSTMEELIAEAQKDSTKRLVFDIGNLYYSGAFINTFGGYVFGGENGDLDPTDVGMDNEGAMKGYKFLNSLIKEYGIIGNKMSRNDCVDAMKAKTAAYYISGPWDVSGLQEAGINVGIASIPSIEGNSVKTFLGVQTSIVSAKSKNSDRAWEFVKYLETDITKDLIKEGNRISVLKSILADSFVVNNEIMQGFINQANTAIPMPNITEMSLIWKHYEKFGDVLISNNIESEVSNIVQNIRTDVAVNK